MNEPKDIEIIVTNADGAKMELTVPWEDNLDSWQQHIKVVLVHIGFFVDEVVINPESDDPQDDKAGNQ